METYQTMTRAMQISLVALVHSGQYGEASKLASKYSAGFADSKPKWHTELAKLAEFLEQVENGFIMATYWSVFGENGNDKLPFVAFSALSGYGFCPGAGECEPANGGFCYTPRSWRYPAAFCRQIQNTILQLFADGMEIIRNELARIMRQHAKKPSKKRLVLRLFVDGDFMSLALLLWWMEIIRQYPELDVYGYSKSLDIMLNADRQGIIWPANYIINLSSGHKYSAQVVEKVKLLPIYRDEFIALPYDGPKLEHGTRAYNETARKLYQEMRPNGKKPFVCPGKCGECTASTHACGSMRFKGIPVVILAH